LITANYENSNCQQNCQGNNRRSLHNFSFSSLIGCKDTQSIIRKKSSKLIIRKENFTVLTNVYVIQITYREIWEKVIIIERLSV